MLEDFRTFLSVKERVPDKNIPYYMKRVADCYRHFNLPETATLAREQVEAFLKHMALRHEDWQVEQANRAITLYQYFLSRPPADSSAPDQICPDWKTIETRLREALRLRHRSYSTEKTYVTWTRHFGRFVGWRSPAVLTGKALQDFLSHQAVEKRVSASTQNQALNALVFLYRHVLDIDIEGAINSVRARKSRRLPVVLTKEEIDAVFSQMQGLNRLMARLIYGCGLRLQECLQLRIKDLDLEQGMVIVRAGKGDKDRRTVLPESLKKEIAEQIVAARAMHEKDRAYESTDDHDLYSCHKKEYPWGQEPARYLISLRIFPPYTPKA